MHYNVYMATEHVSVNEAALILRCDPATIKRRIYSGKLPAERIGAVWLIRRVDLEQVA